MRPGDMVMMVDPATFNHHDPPVYYPGMFFGGSKTDRTHHPRWIPIIKWTGGVL